MRGTGYAIAEIAWWMLAAGSVGFFIGWFVRRWRVQDTAAAAWEPRLQAASEEAATLRAQLQGRSEAVARTKSDVAAAQGELERVQAERDALAAEAKAGGESTAQLEARLGTQAEEIERLREELAVRESGLALRNEELADLRTRLTSAREEPRRAPRRADGAASQVVTGGGVETAVGDLAEDATVPANAKSREFPDKAMARTMIAEIAARTRGDERRVEDDLKRIRGIGPKLEELLKSFDITSFRQVANFTPDDIAFVTAALEAFPGRIERDDWMSSAAEEHYKKYGTPAR